MNISVTITDELLERIAARAAEIVLQQQEQESPYLDAEEAATFLRCKRDRVYDLIQLGKLTAVGDGRRVLLRRADLKRYVEGGGQ